MHSQTYAASENRRGYTLVELLVVVAIIALLLSILLPSFKAARDKAKGIKCSALQHGFATGFGTYFTEFDQWIPGRNTTGLGIWTAELSSLLEHDPGRMNQSHLPVQTYDWMTPILSTETQLPANRARRFRTLLEDYACPAVNFKAVLYVDRGAGERLPSDHSLFVEEVERNGAYRGTSYLMPVHFQHWGQRAPGPYVGTHPRRREMSLGIRRNPSRDGEPLWEVSVVGYTSRADKVGTPAEKIAVADGTRFLPRRLMLDFDHDTHPDWFGAFTGAGGWWRGSIAYGDDPSVHPKQSGGGNLPLSFRHSDGISALFFDGHVERLSRTRSRKIDYWYPQGGVVVNSREGYTDHEEYPDGYVIR